MEQLTKDLAENQKQLDNLLGVGRNYDVISRDLYIGAWKGRLYVIDGENNVYAVSFSRKPSH